MLLLTVMVLAAGVRTARAQDKAETKKVADPAKSQQPAGKDGLPEARRKQVDAFEKLLTSATLVGHFTTDGNEGKPAKPDRYSIARVSYLKEDQFLFLYDHKGVPIPLTLNVYWAGRTPVITLDEFTIPGMGTFSARVMFHGDRYAGTWQHGKVGGLMYGKVDSPALKKAAEEKKAAPKEEEKE